MKNILVATDGSPSADRAVARAAELAGHFKAKLKILNVVDVQHLGSTFKRFAEVELPPGADRPRAAMPVVPESYGLQDIVGAISAADTQSQGLAEIVSQRVLGEAARAASALGAADVETISAAGDAAHQITATAKSVGADLIVVGRRGLSGIAELLLGSVSQKVLHHAEVDVLTTV